MTRRDRKTTWRWRKSRDPLFRGDGTELTTPTPGSDLSFVDHILYIGGRGRETPYLSLSESEAVAERFAGSRGKLWRSRVPDAESESVRHVSRTQLLSYLKGAGKGEARGVDPYLLMRARSYVESSAEHLYNFSELVLLSEEELVALLGRVFE